MPDTISSLLLDCEKRGLAKEYTVGGGENPRIVEYDGDGREVVVVSDLHMAAGLGSDGRYSGTENFFCDGAFGRFIDDLRREIAPGRGLLVINGDVIDFMRMMEVPSKDDEFELWRQRLAEIGIEKSDRELRASVSPKEKEYGFKTHDFKSAWRLWKAMDGHPEMFAGLARWLGDAHRLTIVKGNHDLEWYWLAVRNALRIGLGKLASGQLTEDLQATLAEKILPNLDFIDDAVVIDTDLYIEHGHRYDRQTFVVGEPVLAGGEELNIPFGSFFNRYLINGLEEVYPYFDNIRPKENLLPLLIRERFPMFLRVLFEHIPFVLMIVPKNYYRYIFGRFLTALLVVLVPVVIGLIVLYNQVPDVFASLFNPSPAVEAQSLWERIGRATLSLFGGFGWMVVSYFLARILAWFQITEPDTLNAVGERILKNPDYRIVTMGHTHSPDQLEIDGRWFYNTGTWIPVVENRSAAVRDDKTFCFLRLRRTASGRLQPSNLQRWNDAAGRADPLVIVHNK